MTTAVFTLFVASGLCLTFAAITTIHAIRILDKSHEILCSVLDLIPLAELGNVYGQEGTD